MPEKQSNFDRMYDLFLRFAFLGSVFLMIAILFLAVKFMSHMENLAPAEMRLLLDVLKNRFFR